MNTAEHKNRLRTISHILDEIDLDNVGRRFMIEGGWNELTPVYVEIQPDETLVLNWLDGPAWTLDPKTGGVRVG